MKNALLRFAGLFVERVPIDDAPSQVTPVTQPPRQSPPSGAMQGSFASRSGATAYPTTPDAPQGHAAQAISVALRAWVPPEYTSFLVAHGLHVIAAGGEILPDQARSYGGQVLIVSGECLGSHIHLLSHPQMPTVFVAQQPVNFPEQPGVVHVQEPLRASEVAAAAREALASWNAAHGA